MMSETIQQLQEENVALREENTTLREENAQLRALVEELLPVKTQVEELSQQVKQLQGKQAKDSHNSHLPPSTDRFVKKTKSLRRPSGKKPGGQVGHEGNTLYQVKNPDEIIVH